MLISTLLMIRTPQEKEINLEANPLRRNATHRRATGEPHLSESDAYLVTNTPYSTSIA